MPRDAKLVGEELSRLNCEVPTANIAELGSFYLMPDETITAALLGRGKHFQSSRDEIFLPLHLYHAPFEYDEILLMSTRWRIMAMHYKYNRDRSWKLVGDWNGFWRNIGKCSGWENQREKEIRIHVTPHVWVYQGGCIARDRLDEFLNTAQRKLQAVEFVSGQSYSPVSSNVVDALERLAALRQQGHLSEEEFLKAKERLLFG